MTNNVTAPLTSYQCMDCDWKGTIDDLSPVADVHQRVEVGELMPAGECPECGMLVPVEDTDIPEWVLEGVKPVMQARGWIVVPPSTPDEQAEAACNPTSSSATPLSRGMVALPSHKPYIDAARSQYTADTDDVEIDDEPSVAPTDDGVWIAAWVWIGNGELSCPDCSGAGRGGANTTDGSPDDDCCTCSGGGHVIMQ